MASTVMDVFEATVKARSGEAALCSKQAGEYREITWAEYADNVMRAARGFIHLGLQPGGAVSIIGYNCPEWLYSDLAAIAAGGMPAGIYTTSSPEQCAYIAGHSESTLAVVENAEHLAKFLAIRDQLPELKAIVLMHGESSEEGVYSWRELLELGDRVDEARLRERINVQEPQDVATLIYTSGTTGKPKAVMITHRNLTWTAARAVDLLHVGPSDQTLSYLPLSHIAEQDLSIHVPMAAGSCLWFAESMDALGENLAEVRPTLFLGVPRVWEKIQEKMEAAGAQNSPLRKRIAAWARRVGLAAARAEEKRRPRPLLYPLARKLVFTPVRNTLGLDRARYLATAAAPISDHTLAFFNSLDLRLHQVFGLSETTGATSLNRPERFRSGTVGQPWPGLEVKTDRDGEICLRGPCVFRGYLKNEQATAESFDAAGWYHTGDVGGLDEDGFLLLTDRKKDIVITAGGENVAPAQVESALQGISALSQVLAIGDRRKYMSALFTLNPETIEATALAAGSPARDVAEASRCEHFRAYLQTQVDQANEQLARVQRVKAWSIVEQEFSIEGGELTPTMKMKRNVIQEKYSDRIEGLYRPSH